MKQWMKQVLLGRTMLQQLEVDLKKDEVDAGLISFGTCPECLANESMRFGPVGGVTQNLMCIDCRAEFSVAFTEWPPILLDRLGRTSDERARTIYGRGA